MLSKNLKVIGLSITEDYYNYAGTFRLCSEEKCIDINLAEFNDEKINEIKEIFDLDESVGEIREEIMSKAFEAARIESRFVEGKSC